VSRSALSPKSVSIPLGYDIHAYIALIKLLREIAREYFDCTLEDPVCGKGEKSDPRKVTRQVHDPTAIGDDWQELFASRSTHP
jgi:hypothetical protein